MSSLDTAEILRILPHRPPMLFIDRVVEVSPNEVIRAEKEITAEEPALEGHFPPPGRPVMPGVLILETMAQAGAILVHATEPFDPERQPLTLLGVDRARFRRFVVPGDTLRVECTIAARRGNTWRLKATARVGDEVAADASFLAQVGDGTNS